MAKAKTARARELAELRAANRALQQQVMDLRAEIAAHAEETLPDSEAGTQIAKQFQLADHIVSTVQNLVFVANEQGEITFASPSVYRLLGYSPDEVLGDGWLNLTRTDSEERQRVKHYLSAAAKGEREINPTPYEREVQDKQGNRRWILWQDARGPGNSLIGIGSDITERKRLEEALQRNEAYFRSIIEKMSDIVTILNKEGTVHYQSPALEPVLGYKPEERVGKNSFELIHPEDVAKAKEAFAHLIQVPGHTASLELRFQHKDGSWRVLEAGGINLLNDPAVTGIVIRYRDITMRKRLEEALRESEARVRTVVSGAPIILFAVDHAGVITLSEGKGLAALGLTPGEAVGRSVFDLYRDMAQIRENIQRALAGEEFIALVEINNLVFETRYAPLCSHKGEVTGVIGVAMDITERQAIERMKDEFVSIVSHELRTPLTSMRGALGLLESGMLGSLPEKGRRMLEIAVNNTDRLARLINDILDIERMQSGKVTMRRQLCDAAVLLTQAVEEMQGMADKAGITLTVASQPLPLWADPDRIMQTLTNLLSNAIKFSTAGSTVWVSTARQGEEAVFTVRDQGRGIPTDKLETVFERFQQVDSSDSRRKGGTGLGLAICRNIVRQHGGQIWAESRPGEGSTFSFTLPLSKEGHLPSPTTSATETSKVCPSTPSRQY
jgi:PAS domain S-box-containing protein